MTTKEEAPHDLVLHCVDCDREFIWSIGEQEYFSNRQLSPPKRCRDCRLARRARIVPDVGVRR